MTDEQALTPELSAAISALLPAVAWTSTVPIMVMYKETLAPHGTGTLFRIADAHFLITAAHVLEQAEEHQAIITVGARGQIHPLQIAGKAFKSSDDSLDVAIWRLDDKSVGFLAGNTFLSLADIYTPETLTDDFYFVCGFPCEHSTSATTADEVAQNAPFQFCTTFYDGDKNRAPGFDPKVHVLLSAGREYLYKGEGADRNMPERFNGFSGCSIWIARAMREPRSSWKPGQAKLAAIQTCAYPNRKRHEILRGTTWKAVGSLIVAVYPELRPAFEIVYR